MSLKAESKNMQYLIYQMLRVLPDRIYLGLRYRQRLGFWPNLSKPKRFTEKLQWLKLNERDPRMTEFADKLNLKALVSRTLGPDYVIPSLAHGASAEEFTLDVLGGQPCVLKTNHDSGGTLMLPDPGCVDCALIRAWIRERLSRCFYLANREWEYKNIRRKWFVEPLLRDHTGNARLNDFKVHCFNGKPQFIQTIFDRGKAVKENWFDVNWQLVPIRYFSQRSAIVKEPACLGEILELAGKMASFFSYARVDFYVVDNRPIIGEITFRPYGGFMRWEPPDADFMLGEHLQLSV